MIAAMLLAATLTVPPRCVRMCSRAPDVAGCEARCAAILADHERRKAEATALRIHAAWEAALRDGGLDQR